MSLLRRRRSSYSLMMPPSQRESMPGMFSRSDLCIGQRTPCIGRLFVREHDGNSLGVAQTRMQMSLVTISDENGQGGVYKQQMRASRDLGIVTGDLRASEGRLRSVITRFKSGRGPMGKEAGSRAAFMWRIIASLSTALMVTAAQKRVLEGATMAVTINSRYFFGEPVANAKVKYRVYHERHYWWGEEEDD